MRSVGSLIERRDTEVPDFAGDGTCGAGCGAKAIGVITRATGAGAGIDAGGATETGAGAGIDAGGGATETGAGSVDGGCETGAATTTGAGTATGARTEAGISTSTEMGSSNVGTRGGVKASPGVGIFAPDGTGTQTFDATTLLCGAGGMLLFIAAGAAGAAGRTETGAAGGIEVFRGAGGGVDLIGATATPTMSPSSRSSVARRSRTGAGVVAGGATEVLASVGPDAGGGGTDAVGRGGLTEVGAAGAVEGFEDGRGIDGRTLALMPWRRARDVPLRAGFRSAGFSASSGSSNPVHRRSEAVFLDRGS